ncbi:acid protease [Peniophora sp. CONT]|nr:acid protease [Peniophora sp. CONT]
MLLALLSLPALAAGLPQHLPLVRQTIHRRGDFVDLNRIASSAESLRYKYGFKAASQLGRRASEDTFGVINQGSDLRYLTTLSVGTPPQSFNVILDTGSSDLWFATTDCQDCPSGTPEFNTSQSSTLNTTSETVLLQYGTGNATGTLLQDTVSLGSYTIPNQAFTGVTNMGLNGLINGTTTGILGLAFENLAYSGATPFWQSLINAGELSSPVMAFYFKRLGVNITGSTTDTHPGGTFTLGGTNSSFYKGDIEFHSVPNVTGLERTFWLQTLTGLTVNGNSLDLGDANNNTAVIDTGSSFIGGPTAAVQAFWAQIDGSLDLSEFGVNGFWGFPCATNVTATLAFGGRAWTIPADDINLGQAAEGICVGSIFDARRGVILGEGFPNWLIGDAFLKNVYTVYRAGDNPAVGFAELADGLRD